MKNRQARVWTLLTWMIGKSTKKTSILDNSNTRRLALTTRSQTLCLLEIWSRILRMTEQSSPQKFGTLIGSLQIISVSISN